MSQRKELFKNTFVFFVNQVFIIAFRFISKPIMLACLGEEILGIGSAITSLLSTLSLAELGFHAAVIYHLYKPLLKEDYDTCNEYMMVLKRFYQVIAAFIFLFTLILSPFLHVFLKNVVITPYVYAIYFLSGFTSAASYLFADKLQLLFADRKDYVSKRIDLFLGSPLLIAELVLVVITKNYLACTIMTAIRTLSVGILSALSAKRRYVWLKPCKINRTLFRQILADVKNLSIANFAGYVYYNTDNLVVSTCLGAATVTYLTNYVCITSSLRTIADYGIRQIEPFIGQIYAKNNSKETNMPYFLMNTFVRFIISGLLVIPSFLLMNSFITVWVGEKYILSNLFLILLCGDFYLFIVHRALSDYITITGSYNYEKKISLIGALLNLGSSLLLVQFMGLEGILVGTVISEFFYWGARGFVVFRKIFDVKILEILAYVIKNLAYIIVVIASGFLSNHIIRFINLQVFVIDFIVKGITIEIVFCMLALIIFGRSTEMRNIISIVFGRKKQQG